MAWETLPSADWSIRSNTDHKRMATVTNGHSQDSHHGLPSHGSLVRKEVKVNVTLPDLTLKVHAIEVVNGAAIDGGVGDGLSVLFLHSGRFTSQNWVDIGTLDRVAASGFRAVAVDLPGKGQTSGPIDRSLNAQFLTALVEAMDLRRLVIVSPSSSGRYTLPFLFKDAPTSTARAVGFVPIAPGGTKDFREKYPDSKLQTLIVYGTDDPEGQTTLDDLKLLPNSQVLPIEGAGHPCYMEQPDIFHTALLEFLRKLAA
ncbi:hypothetical protein RRG08_010625 [Elysia crispata]|uniref:AB hydrolase-1 domain-containing protein n=1 Tax=Elysia crispata TaxID=231223 RepID=A0AAE0Y948_9GAST|nr:hypothetical protein RRG08_010625 [Elysia crispata]